MGEYIFSVSGRLSINIFINKRKLNILRLAPDCVSEDFASSM